ncbi:MAG: amino acid ABC transporter permease [Ilumatobacter sp.]|uniref:amino acid ABC transporter permease n=1 Tax=Ilumatobacter sp. TaxID=1967498 RepID=UPI00260E8016|nr:amino acid ABC transporter permease [Ilumatobacter sp.]MDJ0771295.1 amino acid ABC transporter permease [Ilumatobacter sp.]
MTASGQHPLNMMTFEEGEPDVSTPKWGGNRQDTTPWYDTFPWWTVLIAVIIGWMGALVAWDAGYNRAFDRIIPGIWLTIRATLWSFFIACVIGLVVALARTSRNVVARNVARTYVEFIRGIPILVLIFTFALVVVPEISDALGQSNRVSPEWRAIIALSLIYGGYIAEIFRAGIQAVDAGQVEAGRSLGLTRRQTTRSIVLPQAVRAVVPPLGNDFIAILKDTSLLSVLGVLDLTLRARQYASGSFKFRDSYLALSFVYLTLTVVLSILLQFVERRLNPDRMEARA